MAVSKIYTVPSVHITPIPISFLRFPPDALPSTVPPPSGVRTLSHPFPITPDIYNALLSVYVPITVALIYATSVTILDRYNAKRDFEPWPISKTRAFGAFVIAHNVFLALFSAWTFVGLVNAVTTSLDGANTEHGWVGVVDALCKINGPRGLGDAATFNSSTSGWGFTNRALRLAADQLPDTTDIGRIWNEGLAFYGWLFYLSKFYEVVDTLIIIAKGKKTSFLQTYHHVGAMICMWAGIRYMAPPIWMFVLVNSFIHVLMYTYYTATASGVRVPKRIKQLITTMQIVQFLVGASFALAHLFISYTIPVSVPYIYSFADLTSGLASDVSSAASIATASASAGLGSWLKKVAFRAAGEEGLAENIRNEQGKAFGIDAVHAAKDLKAREETRYRDELRMVHCTDTSGQVFAILINCFYLAPLTFLFVQFFISSYLKRGGRQQGKSSQFHLIEESSKDAIQGVKRELDQALDEQLGSMEDQSGEIRTWSKEKHGEMNKEESSKERMGESKEYNGKESSSPGSGGQGEEEEGVKVEDNDKEDVEILDSAEAVTDVLDAATENANKFSKDLKNSKAG